MQYGAELLPYQRLKKIEKQKYKKSINFSSIVNMIIFFMSSFLVSRVIFINNMAPFGIAFLLSISRQKEYNKYLFISAIGSVIGYISLKNNIGYISLNILEIATIILSSYIFKNVEDRKNTIIIYMIIYLEIFAYKIFVTKISTTMAMLGATFEIGCIFPIYYIINYSILCFKNINTSHLYSNEEIVSMAITLSLVVSGTWGANIAGINLMNLISITMILIIGYVKGSTSASAIGVAMGAIVGLSSNNMMIYISIYGLCGLISGVFKETGKLMTGISYLVSFLILKFYSNINYDFKIIEVLISLTLFYIIPNKLYMKMEYELDYQKKQENLQENYMDKIKGILTDKLGNFSDVLYNMGNVLEKLVDNEKLAMKNKSGALIENLADRVCSNCNMNHICWKREGYYTYNALGELIQNYQENRKELPYEIERKCVKRTQLINNTEDIVNNYIINEMWKKRLSECREVLANQINTMAYSVEEITKEFGQSIRFSNLTEKDIRRMLNKNNIKYKDIFCYNNENGRLIINLKIDACTGKQKCVKEILPLINKVTGKLMCVANESCNLDLKNNDCNIIFEETPKYHVASYVNKTAKDGEQCNGDSYSFGKLKSGSYMTVISDGMGSGPQAVQESSAVVELIERFAQSGFSKLIAINTINSIMSIKFSQDEKFSTVDLSNIDLYEGKVDFMKVGAVASFIKRGTDVYTIKSKTLPIGVLDKVDIDIETRDLKNGDIIVMVSDGVLDYESSSAGKVEWVVEFLKNTTLNNPKEISEELIENAKKLSKGKVKDDMTAIVQKVYSLY
ncbi:stage II sporulation protein E [Clostridium botulinum]|nr:stage II sporulation protein E [Clostridium botulinum]